MARKKLALTPEPADGTAYILQNPYAEFVLMHTNEIKYMCMLGYTFLHGSKVFTTFGPRAPFSYKFISMVMACTGGGILVPIFINAIPVPLAQDAYPIAIAASFALHSFFPILKDVLACSPIFQAAVIFLYETMRATVVVKLTTAAGMAIAPTEFSFPLFGPIFCGTVAGCGGAFLPLNKGLDPIKDNGLAPPMLSAFVAALCFHLFINTSLSDGIKDAKLKAHVAVSTWFILHGWYQAGIFSPAPAPAPKKEKTG